MDPVAAKFLGAGLACIGMGGAAIGVATVFGQFLTGALRNPSAAAGQNVNLFLGFALAEAFGIFSLLIAARGPSRHFSARRSRPSCSGSASRSSCSM